MAKSIGRWLLVLVAFLAGAIVIPYAIHAVFLLCISILPFDLNWLPDTRIFRSALGGFLAIWLPMITAPSHERRVAVGALVGIGVWLEESTIASIGLWTVVTEIGSAALATTLALVLHRQRG